jgi:subfamily B ATP-binding cassette protein MsbA
MLRYFSRKFPFVGLSSPSGELILSTAIEQWKLIAASFGSAVVGALSEGATLAIVFLAVDVLTANRPIVALPIPGMEPWPLPFSGSTLVVFLMFLALCAQAIQSIMRYANSLASSYFGIRCRAKVTALVHQRVLSFSFPCSSHYKVGELTNYLGSASSAVEIQIRTASDVIVSSLMALMYFLVLIKISTWLLISIFIIGAVLLLLQKYLEPRLRHGSERQALISQAISSRSVEDYQALRLLHTLGQLDQADQRFSGLMSEFESAARAQSRRLSFLEPLSSFLPILAIAIIVTLSLAFLGSKSGQVLPGLVTFVIALQRLNMRVSSIFGSFNIFADNTGRLDLANRILDVSDKQFRRRSGHSINSSLRSIVFDGVSLRYQESSDNALSCIDFTLHSGMTLALVGPSGAGKSSIADLIVGLYYPSSGFISINGHSILDLDLPSWQRRLGVVSQDTFLFNASIAENLTFGLEGVTQQQLELAAAQAQAAGFIESLPDGYNTLVGERGYRLSGGQRQRLSLARALLRQPELLILDEATSALDSESERLVQEAIQQVEGQCSVLVIAHRLSTVVNADQILVLDRGRIIQRGNHQQLLASPGMYQRLWQQQSKAAAI